MTREQSSDIVRASEIGEYVYCARAWWLHRVEGVASRNAASLAEGRRRHDRHGRGVSTAQVQRRAAWLLAGLAVLAGLAAFLLALGGVG